MKFLAELLGLLGMNSASIGTQGCRILFMDEPEMPKCLLDK